MAARTSPWDERYYGLSRSLYRAAAACATCAPLSGAERLRLLGACEYAIQRLVDTPESGRCVRRWLYREVQEAYALEDRPTLWATLRGMIDRAAELIEETQLEQVQLCSALTRSGTPCQREARSGSEFCPSHRHLELVAV
jgi:hypothetical protein